jgi:hypothetical protein
MIFMFGYIELSHPDFMRPFTFMSEVFDCGTVLLIDHKILFREKKPSKRRCISFLTARGNTMTIEFYTTQALYKFTHQ